MGLRVLDVGRVTAAERTARAAVCGLTVMAKAPRAGRVKTRLSPPLTAEQAAGLHECFLRDTLESLAGVVGSEGVRATGLVSYTPVGDEAVFEGLAPDGFALVAQREGKFGQRLLGAAEDVLACGFGSVCLIDSDSPTVPRVAYERAVRELAREGERVVLGPAQDGGYYLIGTKRAEARVFEGIAWSTETVYAETCARAEAAGLDVVELPLWYDVDDAATLEILRAELLAGMRPGFAVMEGYDARWTREFLMGMKAAGAQSRDAGRPSVERVE
jgi:rSAM/selenodomain-associated transferase 1